MPLDLPTAHRIHAHALVTDIELAMGSNFITAHIRERLRDELFDAIVRQALQHEDLPGGRRYWMDVLVLSPETMLRLVQAEAVRLLKDQGYAVQQ